MYKRIRCGQLSISRSFASNEIKTTMKVIIVALAFVAVAAAAAIDGEPPKILRSDYDQKPNGAYDFRFETEDGTSRQENGEVKTVQDEDNKPVDVLVVRGQVSWIDNEGNPQSFSYVADEKGYQAEGPGIPKPSRR